MQDEIKVRQDLGVSIYTHEESELISEALRYIHPEDFKCSLSGTYFLLAAVDQFSDFVHSNTKRRRLRALKDKIMYLLMREALDVGLSERGFKGTFKDGKGSKGLP